MRAISRQRWKTKSVVAARGGGGPRRPCTPRTRRTSRKPAHAMQAAGDAAKCYEPARESAETKAPSDSTSPHSVRCAGLWPGALPCGSAPRPAVQRVGWPGGLGHDDAVHGTGSGSSGGRAWPGGRESSARVTQRQYKYPDPIPPGTHPSQSQTHHSTPPPRV